MTRTGHLCEELEVENFSPHSRVTQQRNTNLYVLSHIDSSNYGSLLCPVRRVGLNQMFQINN